MTLWLQPVAGHERKALLSLQLFAHQQDFIETIPEILHEADRDNTWQLLGIYQGKTLIGLAMYGDFAEPLPDGELWLNQILLDCRYQGKGLGKAALQLILARLADEFPQRREVFLSVFAENTAAIRLYWQAGFAFNGALDTEGEKIMSGGLPR